MKITKKILIVFFVVGTFLGSCIEQQNFDQYDDLRIIPTYEASILYIESPERLINLVTGVNFISQNFNFDAFSAKFFSKRVLSGSITYQIENTTSKRMEIKSEFLDADGNVLDTENFTVEAAPTPIVQREIVYGDGGRSINIIKNTSSIRVSATNLGDNTSTSSLPDPKIILRSSGKFKLLLK